MKRLLLVLLASVTLTACSKDRDDKGDKKFSLESANEWFLGSEPIQGNTFSIVDINNNPISGAQILIGQSLGSPFDDNFLVTDNKGQVLIPIDWRDQPVTIQAPGFIRTTFFNQDSSSKTFKLRPLDGQQKLELAGITTGYGSLPRDGVADFGLVIPAISRADIMTFDMNMVLSPEMDTMEIAGYKNDVPSNTVFPTQKESYIIPITLNKERYRLYFNEPGVRRLYAVRGKFNFKTVVKKLQDRASFSALINDFDLISVGIRDIEINSNKQFNMPINDITYGAPMTMTTPAIERGQTVIGVALADNGGYMLPSDLKRAGGNQTLRLKTVPGSNMTLLSVLKRPQDLDMPRPENQNPLSAVMVPFTNGYKPQFISFFAPPPVANETEWQAKAPQAVGKINPMATYAVMSTITRPNPYSEIRYRLWEAYANHWTEGMQLPEWPGAPLQDRKRSGKTTKRWEIIYLGDESAKNIKLGHEAMSNVSHISYNAKDF